MAKPVIWTVDDDPDVLRAVERDLRRHYGDRYRVISADSGLSALEATKQLKLRNESIALFLVDQRMPRMSGVEFLEKAIELYPEAKKVGHRWRSRGFAASYPRATGSSEYGNPFPVLRCRPAHGRALSQERPPQRPAGPGGELGHLR